MNDTAPQYRLFAAWAEAPLAFTCLCLAVVTVIWKTVGLAFLPGWEEIFGGLGSQYPRRVESVSPAWKLGYFLMYGVLGTVATAASVLVTCRRGSLSSPAGLAVSTWARVLGGFHVLIGIHHTLWAATRGAWGHLTLEQFDVPGLYVIGGIAGCATGLHGLRLLRSQSADPTYRIVRSKIAVDGASLLTFISVLIFFPMNALGLPRNALLEQVAWSLVFVGPAVWLLLDAVISRTPRSGSLPSRDAGQR
ncbi:hypothetical protein JN531_006535 [Flagellatimonas centrodinii]|uniref:hypothetical protein n=1 Tax=Flagellatimonas centrodinii TaxID=2806210 RepID=UPI001FEEF638|nr:hypothetical protein [Flagellatimonas centrodinii]ULQ47943.1 hypothetical protein JN531_006535 [Flagellatimonas centrodinii]